MALAQTFPEPAGSPAQVYQVARAGAGVDGVVAGLTEEAIITPLPEDRVVTASSLVQVRAEIAVDEVHGVVVAGSGDTVTVPTDHSPRRR